MTLEILTSSPFSSNDSRSSNVNVQLDVDHGVMFSATCAYCGVMVPLVDVASIDKIEHQYSGVMAVFTGEREHEDVSFDPN